MSTADNVSDCVVRRTHNHISNKLTLKDSFVVAPFLLYEATFQHRFCLFTVMNNDCGLSSGSSENVGGL